MNGRVQMDLFPREAPEDLLGLLDSRLPQSDLVSTTDVASAVGISKTVVYALIQDGTLQVFNVRPHSRKAYYKIWRKSVLAYFKDGVDVEQWAETEHRGQRGGGR